MPSPIDLAKQELASGIREPAAFARYAGGRDESWCAHFVSWLFAQAGYPFAGYIVPTPTQGSPTANVMRVASNMQTIGRLYRPGEITPQANDLIFYKTRSRTGGFVTPGLYGLPFALGHIGIVEGIDGDKVVTIEGNYSDKVARVRTPLNSDTIAFYGRPLTTTEVAVAGGIGIGAIAALGIGTYLLLRSRR